MKKRLFIILIILFLSLGGCSGGDYTAEKLYWRANKQYNELLKNVDEAKAKDFQKVIFAYRELIGRFPKWNNTPNAYFSISQLYVLQKEYSKAGAELEKVKENFSDAPDICANADFTIGLIYEEEGNWQEALKYFKEIEDNYPLSYSALQAPLHIARHYKLAKDEERANEAYQNALSKYKKLISENPNTLGALAAMDFVITAYAEQDKKEALLTYLDGLIEKHPESAIKAKALLSKGIIYYNTDNVDKSIECLKIIISDYPDSNLAKMAEEQIKKIKEKEEQSESKD